MRSALPLLGAALLLTLPGPAAAQRKKDDDLIPERVVKNLPPAIRHVRVGFRPSTPDEQVNQDALERYKVGLMTPVYVEVEGGSKGIERPKAGEVGPYLTIETTDSEDVGTIFRLPVEVPKEETRVFVGYTKPGYLNSEIKIQLHAGDRIFPAPSGRSLPMDVHTHLYVTLGSRVPDLQAALNALIPQEQQQQNLRVRAENGFRYVGHESMVGFLPEAWYGYEGVDLLFLTTGNKDFLSGLGQATNKERLRAIAGWVKRGGRLVIPVAWQNQDLLANALSSPVWQPPIPAVPPAAAGDAQATALRRLPGVETWGGVQNRPFPAPDDPAVPVARLDPGRVPAGDWEVAVKSEDGRPLIAHVRYGLGQITYLAFAFNDPKGFARWDGRTEFLQGLVKRLAPDTRGPGQEVQMNPGRAMDTDLATPLVKTLEEFDVRVIPFAYVALFIILYILVVGPLDFFLLKYVFKRLELTWITFPTVVIAVSVVAYFAAYAIKGNDLKVNQVDVVDFDLRTGAQAKEPQPAQAYGRSFFTILSPRIQSYTIGLEPNPAFWGGATGGKPLSADLLSWLGRAEHEQWGMGRSGSQGFFRNPYYYEPEDEAAGLVGVPIPVWTTKSLTAAWNTALERPPVKASLAYHQNERGSNLVLSGTLQNDLDVDLYDAWLMYDNYCYFLEGGLPGVRGGAAPYKVSFDISRKKEFSDWLNQADPEADVGRQGDFKPTLPVKQLLFQERLANAGVVGNHLLRPLDLRWRVGHVAAAGRDTSVREAILFARARPRVGAAEDLTADATRPLPTKLWLGELPMSGKPRPALSGYLHQETYVRVLLPVRPAAAE